MIQDAVDIGYKNILLDTIDTMKPAITLYESFGFKEIDAYYDNPIEGAKYFRLNLTQLEG